jgi:hypothetical protein
MIRAYQLMIMRLVLFQQHQSHDHESDHESGREPGRARREWERRVARGKVGR